MDEIISGERKLEFKNFRNLGSNKKPQEILLNHSLQIGRMGDLVVLVGPNNSGKTNVLEGITKFFGNDIKASDENASPKVLNGDSSPVITLKLKYGSSHFNVVYKYNEEKNFDDYKIHGILEPDYRNKWKKAVIEAKKSLEDFIKKAEKPSDYTLNANNDLSGDWDELDNKLLNYDSFHKILGGLNFFKQWMNKDFKASKFLTEWLTNNFNFDENNAKKYFKDLIDERDGLPSKSWEKLTGMKLIPNVFNFDKANEIGNELLRCSYEEPTSVILSVLSHINVDLGKLIKGRDTCLETKSDATLKNMSRQLNTKMRDISKEFNRMYNDDKSKYSFKFELTESDINLRILTNKDYVVLSRQSTGFKWFFNFYFNFLLKTKVEPGDIILIDEAGASLHEAGVAELRTFLKNYAIKNNITIVAATHRAPMVDTDNLEEVRLVQTNSKNECLIENKFSVVETKNVISEVINALTIHQYQIMDPDKILVFVEGITDYNYLTAFNYMNPNLKFVPINGVTISESGVVALLEMLKSVRKGKLNFFVDGDPNGVKFGNMVAQSGHIVVSTTDASNEIKEIEDAFDEKDVNTFKLISKDYDSAYVFKKVFDKKNISSKAIKNFKKIFEVMSDKFE